MYCIQLIQLLLLSIVTFALSKNPLCPDILLKDINYPHPNDCSKYFKCNNNGALEEMNCNRNLEYDFVKEICTTPNGRCFNAVTDFIEPPSKYICNVDTHGQKYTNYEDNCRSYYVCLYGDLKQLKCNENLRYNVERDSCDWPENVKCEPTVEETIDEPKDDGETPKYCVCTENMNGINYANYEDNCKSYYVCNYGDLKKITCEDGFLYNEKTDCCDWSENVQCKKEIIESEEVPVEESIENPTEDEDEKENIETPNYVCTENMTGKHYANYEDNCKSYFICLYGSLKKIDCTHGLLYNEKTSICDWPVNVQCEKEPIEKPIVSGEENGNNETPEEVPEEVPVEEPIESGETPNYCLCTENMNGIKYANYEENCKSYYVCIYGDLKKYVCTDGFLYNERTDCCDRSENVQCIKETIESEEVSVEEPIEEPVGGTTSSAIEEEEENENNEAPNSYACTENMNGINYANYEDNCKSYYVCNYGDLKKIVCEDGFSYNVKTDCCDWSENVECKKETIESEEVSAEEPVGGTTISAIEEEEENENNETPNSYVCTENMNGINYANYEDNCKSYYVCNYGDLKKIVCEDGFSYNVKTDCCDWSENVECKKETIESEEVSVEEPVAGTTISAIEEEEENENNETPNSYVCTENMIGINYANYEDNCKSYYVCNYGDLKKIVCEDGFSYNVKTDCCDWSENVECKKETIESEEVSVEEPVAGTTISAIEEEEENENNETPNSYVCTENMTGKHYANYEDNCKSYFVCLHGSLKKIECTHGFLYNEKNSICDWPVNVQCEKEPIEEPIVSGEENGNNETPEEVPVEEPIESGETPTYCLCTENMNGIKYANYEENCKSYYVCIYGDLKKYVCTDGFLYNERTDCCDRSENVQCIKETIESEEVSVEEPIEEPVGGTTVSAIEEEEENENNETPNSYVCTENMNGINYVNYEDNCKSYYVCNYGDLKKIVCEDGFSYNVKTDCCDWSENVECKKETIESEEVSAEEPVGGTTISAIEEEEENENSETPKYYVCTENMTGKKYPNYEDDCKSYYLCLYGYIKKIVCNAGFLYNEKTDHCDRSENVQCKKESIESEEVPVEEPVDKSIESSTEDVEENENNEAPSYCVCTANMNGKKYANYEDNCKSYYVCRYGDLKKYVCKAGFLYNEKTDRCDWFKNVQCKKESIESEEVPVEAPIGVTTESAIEEEEENENNEAPSYCVCTANMKGKKYANYEDNCKSYYVCRYGDLKKYVCKAGFLYNEKTDRCDRSENVQCKKESIESEEVPVEAPIGVTTESAIKEEEENENNAVPSYCVCTENMTGKKYANYEDNCKSYYVCLYGDLKKYACNDGLLYNDKIDFCDMSENVVCKKETTESEEEHENNKESEEIQVEEPIEESVENPTEDVEENENNEAPSYCVCTANMNGKKYANYDDNCKSYYVCRYGDLKKYVCKAGFLYNEKTDRCDWFKNVQCKKESIESEEVPVEAPIVLTTVSAIKEEEENENNEAPSYCVCTANMNGKKYANYEDNCKSYYVCRYGDLKKYVCKAGFLYNEKTDRCDRSENVQCKKESIESEEVPVEAPIGVTTESAIEEEEENENNEAPSYCVCTANMNGKKYANYEDNCKSYYVCRYGDLKKYVCKAGFLYNERTDRCDWFKNVQCKKESIESEEVPVEAPIVLTTSSAIKEEEENENNEVPSYCVCTENMNGKKYANYEDNCKSYYVCLYGDLKKYACNDGFLYNDKIDFCDMSENVVCKKETTESEEEHENNKESEEIQVEEPIEESVENPTEDVEENENNEAPSYCVCTANMNGKKYANYDDNCKSYYVCRYGDLKKYVCKAGFLYNEKTDRCDWFKNVQCKKESIESEEVPVEAPIVLTTVSAIKEEEENENNEAPSYCVCTANMNGKKYANYEDNCKSYYVCRYGDLKKYVCKAGFLYNEKTDRCDRSENVQCKKESIESEEVPVEAPIGVTTESAIEEEEENENNEAPSYCVCTANMNGKKYANYEDNCKSYYVCRYGDLKKYVCKAGFLYNERTDRCDWFKNVQCKKESIESEEVPVEAPIVLTTSSAIKEEEENENNEVPSYCVCTENMNGKKYANYEDNCKSYYVCLYGDLKKYACNDGFLYNDKIDFCDMSENVVCKKETTESEEEHENNKESEEIQVEEPIEESVENPTEDVEENENNEAPSYCVCTANMNGKKYANYEDNCKSYYVCRYGDIKKYVCNDGFLYNEKTDCCDRSENVQCKKETIESEEVPVEAPIESPDFYMCTENMTGKKYANYEDDCKSYYICLYENLQKFDCNDGFLYNEKIDFCDWSENVQCIKETTSDDHAVLPSQPEIEIPNVSKESTEKHENYMCKGKFNGAVIPNYEDGCRSYTICSMGKPNIVKCARGLLYNAKKRYCDFEKNVICRIP